MADWQVYLMMSAIVAAMLLGKKLMDYSFENLKDKDFSLEVKILNEIAINLYKNFDFEIKKVLKDYYEDCDGYLMYKKIQSKA